MANGIKECKQRHLLGTFSNVGKKTSAIWTFLVLKSLHDKIPEKSQRNITYSSFNILLCFMKLFGYIKKNFFFGIIRILNSNGNFFFFFFLLDVRVLKCAACLFWVKQTIVGASPIVRLNTPPQNVPRVCFPNGCVKTKGLDPGSPDA